MNFKPDQFSQKQEDPTKNGVNFVFEQHAELSSVGTKEEYSNYLNTIFPDSKIKGIFYHGGDEKNKEFKKREGGIFFTFDENQDYSLKYAGGNKENLTVVVLNAREPRSVPQLSRSLVAVEYKEAIERDGIDALIGEESLGIVNRKNENFLARGKSIVVFEPNQIHILGSQDDIAMFQDFMKNQKNELDPHASV